MTLGYDYIVVETDDIILFLRKVRSYHLHIFNLKQIDQFTFSFYTPIYQRFIVRKTGLKITGSVGILHYLLIVFHLPHLFFTVAFLISLLIFPQFVYDQQISGTDPELNMQLESYLQKQIPFLHKALNYEEINQLYDQIKDHFADEIDYLNVYQNGGIIHLEYTNAVSNQQNVPDYRDYVAKKDGIISYIDVKKGNVLVSVNQFVKKGEILISHLLESTDKKTKIIATEGKIYAYTYERYQASLEKGKYTKETDFAYLLFQIRANLPANVKIDKEKVISYDIINNKLVLEVQYVFIENIAVKEK